ncbi:MAG: beta-hydroxyacyl-ACP dehydratase [Firmicutes bacterium]|nr:beta-hydroxyacyl-ACP dehydratase [Bacillota bacterium]
MQKLNKEQLKKLLPHREPMLLLDEVWEGGGQYTFKGDEFFLQGHFPNEKIVPAVILIEIMAQSTCMLPHNAGDTGNKQTLFVGMNDIKIRAKVVPGDTFITEVSIKQHKGPMYMIDAKGFIDGKQVISGVLSFIVT